MPEDKAPPEKTPREKMTDGFRQNDRELAEKTKIKDVDNPKEYENKHPKGPY
jgi:hypothetical protein